MVPLGMGQPPAQPRPSEDDVPSSSISSSLSSSLRTETGKTSPDYGHFARPWRIDQRLLAAELEAVRSQPHVHTKELLARGAHFLN